MSELYEVLNACSNEGRTVFSFFFSFPRYFFLCSFIDRKSHTSLGLLEAQTHETHWWDTLSLDDTPLREKKKKRLYRPRMDVCLFSVCGYRQVASRVHEGTMPRLQPFRMLQPCTSFAKGGWGTDGWSCVTPWPGIGWWSVRDRQRNLVSVFPFLSFGAISLGPDSWIAPLWHIP